MRPYPAALWMMLSATLVAGLPKPASIDVSAPGGTPVFRWDSVEGATLYRLAVFAAPDEEGKRPIMAAVWVKGLVWTYGMGKFIPKAGKLPSIAPKPLQDGASYKVMVRAADEHGSNMSDWVSASFNAGPGAPAPFTVVPSATATPTPQPAEQGTPTATPSPRVDAQGSTSPAELQVDLAGEFKETPEAGEVGLSRTAAPATLEAARALLQQGKADEAEAVYRALLDKDASNADYWEGLGDSYDARSMKIEAKEAYEKTLAIDGKRARLVKWMDEYVKK